LAGRLDVFATAATSGAAAADRVEAEQLAEDAVPLPSPRDSPLALMQETACPNVPSAAAAASGRPPGHQLLRRVHLTTHDARHRTAA
jgi:hypothetical protein